MTDMGRTIRRARMSRGWTQAELAHQIGCSTPAVAGWESGRRLRVDPVYALELSKVMPELNYMELVQKSERECEPPEKPKLDHLRESLVTLPRGLLTSARASLNRCRQGRAPEELLQCIDTDAPSWVQETRNGHLRSYLLRALEREGASANPRGEVLEFLEAEIASAPDAVDDCQAAIGDLRQGDFAAARSGLLERIEQIYGHELPRLRWLLAYALLGIGDLDGALANLRRASGDYAPRVRALLERLRTQEE